MKRQHKIPNDKIRYCLFSDVSPDQIQWVEFRHRSRPTMGSWISSTSILVDGRRIARCDFSAGDHGQWYVLRNVAASHFGATDKDRLATAHTLEDLAKMCGLERTGFKDCWVRRVEPMFKSGDRIVYNDGRPGHQAAHATVLDVGAHGMNVQFEDRASPTRIQFEDKDWMNHITRAK